MIREADILNISKSGDLYNIELNKSSNGYKFFTTPWENIPRYNKKGVQISPEEFKEQVIAKSGLVFFNQNYACQFLGSSYTLLSAEKLKNLVSEEPIEIRDGKLKIYDYPIEHHQYIIAVDPAKDGIDAFAVQIIDITDIVFKQVACANLQVDYLIMPEWLNDWGRYYNNAYMIVENNEGAGQSVADTLYNSYDYGNLLFEKSIQTRKRKTYPGFRTTTHTRSLIINTLRLFSDNNKLIIHDSSTIKELYTFALVDGKYQALEGCHDDMVMSLALAFAPFANARNFDDITQLTKQIYSKNDNYDGEDVKNMAKLLSNAAFDDFGDDTIDLDEPSDFGDFLMDMPRDDFYDNSLYNSTNSFDSDNFNSFNGLDGMNSDTF